LRDRVRKKMIRDDRVFIRVLFFGETGGQKGANGLSD
jgi:hypothetical protein